MPANIRSLRNGLSPVVGASRDDLLVGDVVTVESVGVHSTYSWSFAYRPPGSTASFTGSAANPSPGSFTVDAEGPFLIRLVVDTGLPSESEQFVRLRYLTVFGDLKLVAAGESYGGPVNVPVDAVPTGWADEQNYNLRTILDFVASISASGRILYVDANTGTEGHGDFSTIQAALDLADATASPSTPWIVAVRPGTYTENLALRANVHIIGWPGTPAGDTNPILIRGTHTATLANVSDVTVLASLNFSVHLASTSPGVAKAGLGRLVFADCRVAVDVATPTQGPAIRTTAGTVTLLRCSLVVAVGNPITCVAVDHMGGAVTIHDSEVLAPSGVLVPSTAPVGTTLDIQYSRVVSFGGVGAYAVSSDATATTVEYSKLTSTTLTTLQVHPGAGAHAGGMALTLRWSTVSGTVSFDATGVVGAATLDTGAVIHGGFVLPGVLPTVTASVRADSIAYDNVTSGLTATDGQAAIDELVALLAPFTAGYTLDQAYNGGGPGAGRIIVADSGSVQILDAAFPSDPVPPGNTNGNLEVVGKVSVGALTKPEIDVDPNPYGAGPQVSMGWTVVPSNSPTGVGTATVVARSTEAPLYRNYDLRLGTQPATGGGKVGDVVVHAGDGTQGGGTTPDAGILYLVAGSGLDGTALAGGLFLVPGVDPGGAAEAVYLVDPRTATSASVTASGVCADPVGVTGTITFATDLGAATASILAADSRAAAVAKLDALLGLSAIEAAGVVTISSRTTGPAARVYFLAASAGLDAALGTFDGQSMVSGTYPDAVAIQATAANEVTIGASGITGPLVYNADTGKLTVPGLIDPTGLVLTEQATNPAPVTAGTGTFWVKDDTPSVPMFTDDAGTDWTLQLGATPGVPVGSPLVYHLNLPDSPNDTVEYRGWVPYTCVLKSVRAYMGTVNNQGNYTLDVVNGSTGNSCLLGGTTFDMNTLVVDTVTTVPTKVAGDADLDFSAAGRWTVYLTSDNVAFNGQDVYIELVFGVI